MQYNGYELQITYEGCIIRDDTGKFITTTPTEEEAKEYVDDLMEDETIIEKEPTDWYKRFEKYCSNLKGKCYPDYKTRRFGTIFGTALKGFAKSFEKETDTKVIIKEEYFGGELYYMVDAVE